MYKWGCPNTFPVVGTVNLDNSVSQSCFTTAVQGGSELTLQIYQSTAYTIQTFNLTSASIDTTLTLYNDDGGFNIDYNDDIDFGAGNLASKIIYTATEDALTTIIVNDWLCQSSSNLYGVSVCRVGPIVPTEPVVV